MYVQTAELYVEPPNTVDIEMAISKLRSGKGLYIIALQRPSVLVLLSAFFFV
jgi:hypothetical protein